MDFLEQEFKKGTTETTLVFSTTMSGVLAGVTGIAGGKLNGWSGGWRIYFQDGFFTYASGA